MHDLVNFMSIISKSSASISKVINFEIMQFDLKCEHSAQIIADQKICFETVFNFLSIFYFSEPWGPF